jgi:dihydrodipicolinate synthase/N-acetylneuraminate lyase
VVKQADDHPQLRNALLEARVDVAHGKATIEVLGRRLERAQKMLRAYEEVGANAMAVFSWVVTKDGDASPAIGEALVAAVNGLKTLLEQGEL